MTHRIGKGSRPAAAVVVGLLAGVGWPAAEAEASKFDIGTVCQSDAGCASHPDNPWCDVESGVCSTCQSTDQCTDEDDVCQDGACVRPCAEDLDCAAEAPTCDTGQGRCVMCLGDGDCTAGEYCANGTCLLDACTAAEVDCGLAGPLAGLLVECKADGSGWNLLQDCWAEGLECIDVDGTPMCVGEGETTGGADGAAEGTTAGDDGSAFTSAGSDDGGGDGDDDGAGGAGTGGANGTPAAEGCRSGATVPAAGILALMLPVWLRRRVGAERRAQ